MSADLDERNNELDCGRQELELDSCGARDENNNEREIGRSDFLVFGVGGRTGSVVCRKGNAKWGGQSGREQDGSDWKREGIGTEWLRKGSWVWDVRQLTDVSPGRGARVYATRGDLLRALT